MAVYPLTRGLSALVDDEDLAVIEPYAPWSAGEFGRPGLWYAFTNIKTDKGWRVLYMHRLIMSAPARQPVDHRDDDGLNNQRCNLQFLSHGKNIAKGRRAEQKLFTRDQAPKETTKRRGCRALTITARQSASGTNETARAAG